jgi:hypothetical protein
LRRKYLALHNRFPMEWRVLGRVEGDGLSVPPLF